MDDLSVFTGNANRQLAASICKHLRIPLGDADVFQFSNENIFVKINDNVRGRDVFIIQPFCMPVNRSIMELLIMIDALKRASAVASVIVLATVANLFGSLFWMSVVMLMLAGYLAAPHAVWHLCVNTHAAMHNDGSVGHQPATPLDRGNPETFQRPCKENT